MPPNDTPKLPVSDPLSARNASSTRVDTAHVRAADVAPEQGEPAKPTPPHETGAPTGQQVRVQAAQLAAHLQRQQAGVDHRESELNARLAAMENQVRAARLWLSERHEDLAQRKNDVERREREVSVREEELARDPKAARKKGKSGPAASSGDAERAEKASELDRRERDLDALAGRLGDQFSAAEKTQEVKRLLEIVELRRESLERAEQLLAAEQADLERERRYLAEERLGFAEQAQADRRKWAEEQHRISAEQDKNRGDLKRQADELSARQAAVERLRADAIRVQQETLEIRLATEELWARLCGTTAPAALAHSLAQLRLQLAEQQKTARGELAEQKTELETLSVQLSEQHQRFSQQRHDLRSWMTERQKDLQRQASILVAEQARLDEERATWRSEGQQWQSERFRLQQEIRRLLRQLNRDAAVAA